MRVYKLIIRSLLIGAVAGLIGGGIAEWLLPFPQKQVDDEGIKSQINKLETMQASLEEFQEFISQQKKRLEMDKVAVDNLKNEKDQLEPIVKADREIVESILELQQERFRKQVWKERFIGFLIGFLSSLAASSVFIFLNRKKIINKGAFD